MIKKNDFIEIEYTAKTTEGLIFDSTDENTAKLSGIYQKGQRFGPIIIAVGHAHVLKGLDEHLENKEVGKEYDINLPTEQAFGKKSAQMIQLVATKKFKEEGITPHPGLQVNIDGMFGIIKTVTGGRTLVDFNHPLSGKDLIYTLKINKTVTDTIEKINGLINLQIGKDNASAELKEGELTIKTKQEFGKEYSEKFGEMLQKLIPDIKKVVFVKE